MLLALLQIRFDRPTRSTVRLRVLSGRSPRAPAGRKVSISRVPRDWAIEHFTGVSPGDRFEGTANMLLSLSFVAVHPGAEIAHAKRYAAGRAPSPEPRAPQSA
jgi:hypothetical protein